MLMFGIMCSGVAYIHTIFFFWINFHIHTSQQLNAFHTTCHKQALSHRNGFHPKAVIEYSRSILPLSHKEMDHIHHGVYPYVREREYTPVAPNKFPSCYHDNTMPHQ